MDGWNDLRSSPMLYRRRGCLKIHVSHELYETGKYIGGSWWLATSVGSIGIGWNCNDAMCVILERYRLGLESAKNYGRQVTGAALKL